MREEGEGRMGKEARRTRKKAKETQADHFSIGYSRPTSLQYSFINSVACGTGSSTAAMSLHHTQERQFRQL